MEYIPIQCQSVIHKLNKKGTPYQYDINIYRGCEHGCIYCYALYSHQYLDDKKFFDRIYYKENLLEVLEKELSSPKWKGEVINIGGVCDSYQPAEKYLQLMRGVLKLMIQYKNPVIISTKSKLILRDIDLINELSQMTSVSIVSTITCADEKVQNLLEPHASSSIERMKTLQIIKEKTNVHVGILLMPIVPYVNDSYQNIEAIFQIASKINIDFINTGLLYLREPTKDYFLHKIKEYNQQFYRQIDLLYRDKSVMREYKKQLYSRIEQIRKQYNMFSFKKREFIDKN